MLEPEQDQGRTGGVSRRGMFMSAAGVLAAGPVFAAVSGDANSGEPETWVAGVVRAVTAPNSLVLEPADAQHGAALAVVIAQDASDVDVVPTSSLAPGDEVVAGGRIAPAGLVATRLERMHHVVIAEVRDRNREELETTAGEMRLTPFSSALEGAANGRQLKRRSLGEIRRGDTVAAVVHRDVTSGDLVVTAIGVQD